MVKIQVGIPTVDFIYFEIVGLSSVYFNLVGRSLSRPSTGRVWGRPLFCEVSDWSGYVGRSKN